MSGVALRMFEVVIPESGDMGFELPEGWTVVQVVLPQVIWPGGLVRIWATAAADAIPAKSEYPR